MDIGRSLSHVQFNPLFERYRTRTSRARWGIGAAGAQKQAPARFGSVSLSRITPGGGASWNAVKR
ncbi:hypothetical protein BOO71_0009865 [Deinococcus marmoris]|uniref:Uncharacterized protein n=1 Tax=Deinococcus marmoris TaxID=249408 RepID=A0A1U7NVU0_9DEIO|nr:hypothetical protein BOO71_0009865 [Deinococcus marmoris]